MADAANKYPENVPGKFYVDDQCIDCDLCRETAPANFKRNDDGGHSFADQYEGLKYALPSLADDALVIIDDTNKRNVRSANRLFAAGVAGFEQVLDLRTPRNHSPTWWNGIQLYRVRRPGSAQALDGDPLGYQVRRFLWDDIFLRARHAWRARRHQLKSRLGRKPT